MQDLPALKTHNAISSVVKVQLINAKNKKLTTGSDVILKEMKYEASNLRLIISLKYNAEFDLYKAKVTPLNHDLL
jgi:hypothetical protein